MQKEKIFFSEKKGFSKGIFSFILDYNYAFFKWH